MARAAKRRPEPPRDLDLPELTPFAGDLEPSGDYDGMSFVDRDLAFAGAAGATFSACCIGRCRLDDATFADGHLIECLLVEVGASGIDMAGTTWRDVILDSPRIGALTAVRAEWSSVRIRGGKIDFLVLAGARLDDVVFEDCAIGELDLGDARLRNVMFSGCRVGVLDVEAALLADVDLSGARLQTIRGVGSLRGATVSASQLVEMGPLLAAHLGIRVEDGGSETG